MPASTGNPKEHCVQVADGHIKVNRSVVLQLNQAGMTFTTRTSATLTCSLRPAFVLLTYLLRSRSPIQLQILL